MGNDYILWENMGFIKDLELLQDTINRFNFLEPKHQNILNSITKSFLIKYNSKVEKRRELRKNMVEEMKGDVISDEEFELQMKNDEIEKLEVEEKCRGCNAHQIDGKYGSMCTATMCIKEYDYDPETRVYTPKDSSSNEEDISEINEKPPIDLEGCSCGDSVFSGDISHEDYDEMVVKDSLGNILEKSVPKSEEDFDMIDTELISDIALTDSTKTFLDEIHIPVTNGSKSNCTNSPNFHRKHIKLSKKLTELEDRVARNELITSIILSRYPVEYWYKVSERYGRVLEQKRLIKLEKEKLEVLEKECVKENQ